MRFQKIRCDQDNNEVQTYRNLLAAAFGRDEELLERPMLTGRERAYHTDWAFLAEEGGVTVGGLHLTQEKEIPTLGSLSGMIVRESYRRQGIARKLFAMACETFDEAGGQILYLGTGNPKAAALYRQFGFQFAPGSNVMFRDRTLLMKIDAMRTGGAAQPDEAEKTGGEGKSGSVENELLPAEDAIRAMLDRTEKSEYYIEEISPKMRLRIIPLVLARGADLLMDRNALILSTQKFTQLSCMGLYPRFTDIAENGGRVVCAYDSAGNLCGVATGVYRPDDAGSSLMSVDVFAEPGREDCRERLLGRLIGDGPAAARLADTDAGKQAFFASLGFGKTEEAEMPSPDCPLPVHVWKR